MTDPGLVALVLSEAGAVLQSMAAHLEALREKPDEESSIARFTEAAHTLAGLAAIAGYTQIAVLARSAENAGRRLPKQTVPERAALLIHLQDSVRAFPELFAQASGKANTALDALSLIEKLDERQRRGAPATVLLIDDSVTARSVAGRALTNAGFHVLTAKHEQEASEHLANEHVALILLDFSVLPTDGKAAMQRMLSAATHPPPIILFSHRPEAELAEIANQIGAQGQIPKTRDMGALVAAVRAWLAPSAAGTP